MWGNGDTFWVANDTSGSGTADKLYAYNRSDGSRDSANDFDNLNGAGNNQPEGICSDGTTMFVADSDDNKVYAYKMSDTTTDTTKDITLAPPMTAAKGLWCTPPIVADGRGDHHQQDLRLQTATDATPLQWTSRQRR